MIYAVYVAKNKIEYSWYSENDFQTQSDFLKKKEFADNFVSFVVNIEDVKNQFIHAIRCNENAHENAKKYLEKLLDFLNLKGVIIEKLYVFTHWGNGNDPETVSKEEEQIRNEIENCKDIIGPDSDYEIDNLKQLSLSSLRSEVLAVGAPRIKVPETLYELECLVNDLENIGDKKKEEIMGSAQKQLNKRLRNIKRPRSTKPRKMRIVLIDFSNTETLSEEIRPIKLLERALNDGVSKELNLQFKIKNLDAESLNWSDALPIWIVPSIKRLQKDSFAIPREFVVETLRPYISSREMEQTNVNPEADIESPRLVDRLEQLVMQFQNDDCKTINLRDYMRDWSVGTFRKYCFLDEHVHGSSGLLNIKGLTSEKWEKVADDIIKKWLSKDEYLPELMTVRTLEDALNLDDEIRPALLEIQNSTKGKSDKNKDAGIICKKRYQEINDNRKMFRGRFGEIETNADPLHKYKSLFQILFIEEFERIKNLIEESPTPEKVKKVFSEFDVLEPSENASIPKECGISIRHTSPILKFRVLVIDDKAEEECERLSGLPALKEIFNFFPMPLRGDNIIEEAQKKFKDFGTNTYDFALLDLSLGEEPGSDLYGYQLITLLHQFFPQMPVIIYSQFSDMGHIERAFRYGAKWFLKKNEADKLLRHSISILSLRDWRKEWNSINRLRLFGDIKIKGDKAFTDEQKYLTYKCMEKLPGKDIFVKVMGGGFSSAVTFRARKGETIAGENLQTPVIIKIDTAFNTMTEYERYFRFIRPYIANKTGRVESKELTLNHNNSAITYTFAGKNDSSRVLDTMKNMLAQDVRYMSKCDYKKYEAVFDEIFDDILPKIHRVTPKLESPISSYPNPIFDEIDVDSSGFIGNYLSRMPLVKHFEVKQFAGLEQDGYVPFEVYGIKTEEGQKVIEAYDLSQPPSEVYPKLNVILKGDIVDHVARYRELKQGQTLWADGDYRDTKPVMDGVILESIKDILYPKACKIKDDHGNTEFFDGLKHQFFNLQAKDNEKCDQSKKFFVGLLRRFILGVEPEGKLTDIVFESIVYNNYQDIQEIYEAGKQRKTFRCKEGIVHGDMNFANIMIDSKKNGTRGDAKDVWLIDFARTRRDIIAHDFNVMFTATFSLLFNNELWNTPGVVNEDRYAKRLTQIFPNFIKDVIFVDSDEVPDYVYGDRRFTLFYKIFRRIRKAALNNDNMTKDMYTLTTALCCLYSFKIFLKYEKNIQGAAALLATAYICIEHLKLEDK